jgi:hypothetical protein
MRLEIQGEVWGKGLNVCWVVGVSGLVVEAVTDPDSVAI